MDPKLHQAKVGLIQLKMQLRLRIFFSVEPTIKNDLWAMFEAVPHIFMSLIIKQLLFLDKLATTLIKSAQPGKISKLDF